MKKVLALATCFNRKEKTIKAINSLISGNKDICFSFIICDDNSTDGTYEELSKYKNVEIVKGNGYLFWCGGMRKAIDKALEKTEVYDFSLLFNDDVLFFENSISKLANRNDDSILVGPTCDDKGKLSYGGIVKTSKWRPKYKTIIGIEENGTECDTFNANCVLIPWNIFMKLGNMDETYTHSFGDYDYGFVAKRKGYTIKVAKDYIGRCNNNLSANTFNDISLSIKERLRLKRNPKGGLPFKEYYHYLRKNFSLPTAIIFSITPYIRVFLKK